jgi:hypothetical protein
MAGLITGSNKDITRVGEISLNKDIKRVEDLDLRLISGDTTKGIKRVGELALRISRFDSYRLFTLYENVDEKKVMDVSGNQKYYLVFRSPNKEIRIPEYDPKGFFEVDKVNGCVLFKITKKNAEDILSMKTGGEKIFHIIRVFEETDPYGKVFNVTDEVEVYHGKWGDDEVFTTFNTEKKVDLLTKSLATQVDKNTQQLKAFNELLEKYNDIVKKNGELEEELLKEISEKNSLQTQLNDYIGSTYDGTILSTDTKYIAFEDTLENVNFTEDQYEKALKELLEKGEFNVTDYEKSADADETKINLSVEIEAENEDIKVEIFKDENKIDEALFGEKYSKSGDNIENGTNYIFKCVGEPKEVFVSEEIMSDGDNKFKITTTKREHISLIFKPRYTDLNGIVSFYVDGIKQNVNDVNILSDIIFENDKEIEAIITMNDDMDVEGDDGGSDVKEVGFIGLIGSFKCIVSYKEIVTKTPL